MRITVLSLAILALVGCRALIPRLETPDLSIVNIELMKSDLFSQRARVRLRVQNPNEMELPIKGLSYTVEVAGQEFAQGVSAASFTVPALGETEFDMNVTANMAGAILRLLGSGVGRGDEVDYRMRGKITLSNGWLRYIPFEQAGKFKLK